MWRGWRGVKALWRLVVLENLYVTQGIPPDRTSGHMLRQLASGMWHGTLTPEEGAQERTMRAVEGAATSASP